MNYAPSKRSAPATAFVFAAEACKFASPSNRDNGLRRMDVEVLARTGNPVLHWYFDWIVHDFAGIKHKPKIAFDYRHDPDQPIGFADKFTIGDDLRLGGVLISRTPADAAAEIMDLGPAGVPYEASIFFDPRSLVLEYLPEGTSTRVNNRVVNGPITIAREWELLRVAFCLTGVDGGTTATFESGNEVFDVNWRSDNRSRKSTWETMFDSGTKPKPNGNSGGPQKRVGFHGNASRPTSWESVFKKGSQ